MRKFMIIGMLMCTLIAFGCNSGTDRANLEQKTTQMGSDLVAEVVSNLDFLLNVGADGAKAWLTNWLNQYIFIDEHVEIDEPGRVVYLFKGEIVCSGKLLNVILGKCHGDEDCEAWREDFKTDCAKIVNRIGVRLELTDQGEQVGLSLQVGDHHELVSMLMGPDGFELPIDLDIMPPAITAILEAFGFNPPIIPEQLTGLVLVTLTVTDDGISVSAESPDDFGIEVGPLSVQGTPSPQLAQVDVVGPLDRLEVSADLNELAISWDGPLPVVNYRAKIGLDLSGISGHAVYAGSIDTLVVDDFSLGGPDNALKLNDQAVLGLDIHSPSGRLVHASLDPGESYPLINLFPGVVVDLDFNAAPIDEMLGFELPFLPDAVRGLSYAIALEDAEEHVQLLPVDDEEGHFSALKMLSGLAHLSASDGAEVLVEEGSCVDIDVGCLLQAANFVACFGSASCD